MRCREVGLGWGLICSACGPGPSGPAALTGGEPTKEAQVELVRGVTPAPYRSRLRRYLEKQAENERPINYPPYDLTGTTEAQTAASVRAEIAANLASSDWKAEAEAGKQRVIFTDLIDKTEWEQEYDLKDLEVLFDVAKARGINLASTGGEDGEPESPSLHPLGWSNGMDSRIAKPINNSYPVFHNILMRMGELNRGCSATLVGRRLVLTAAHCAVTSDLRQVSHEYRARGSGTPGTTATVAPFGVVNTIGYWWDAGYDANSCQTRYDASNRETSGRYDWALLLLPDNAWDASPNGTPSWMGYWVPGEAAMLNNYYARNDGYPNCSFAHAPSPCLAHTVYGELLGATSVLFRGPDSSGVNAIFQTANDASVGHSGSAIWSNAYPSNTGGPYVLGVATNESCSTCVDASGTDRSHPNHVRRITPWVGGFITTQRTNYP